MEDLNINNLKTVKHFAALEDITTSYVYYLIDKGQIKPLQIDSVQFIDISTYGNIKQYLRDIKKQLTANL